MATLEQLDAILKDDYKEYWENLNQACWLLAQVETKKDTVRGRIARHAIHTGRSGGIGARREGVALPDADRQRHATVPVPVRWNTGRIQLTQQLISQATGDSASFVEAMESEMDGIRKDAMRDVNRQAWGTSNGVIAQCGTTNASTTVQLASTTPLSAMRHLYVGRVIDIGTVADPDNETGGRSITAVDLANRTITISGAAVDTSGTDFIFNHDSGGASDNSGTPDDGQSELTGLQTIVDDTVVCHTLNPSTTPIWKAQVYANGGSNRALAETMVDYAIMANQVESGFSVDALASNVGVFIAAKAILSAYQRQVDEVEFKGGFKGIKWSTPGISGSGAKDLAWYADFDCPPNRLFGLNTVDGLVVHQVDDGWQWMNADGAILSRVPDHLAYEATLFTSMELATGRRNSHFVIEDLTEVSL